MSLRHYDPTGEHEGAVLKFYRHWILEASWCQHTPGSFIIFCQRRGVRLESELEAGEFIELRDVHRDIERALRVNERFNPDHFNYLQMGNRLPLLHFHGIPRYATPRKISSELFGRDWTDTSWGAPPVFRFDKIEREQMDALVLEMQRGLPKPHSA